jgi:hypothetical protein
VTVDDLERRARAVQDGLTGAAGTFTYDPALRHRRTRAGTAGSSEGAARDPGRLAGETMHRSSRAVAIAISSAEADQDGTA